MKAEQNHAHPVTILANLWRVFYLIIIPVVRGFLSALGGDFASWLSGAWIDIFILVLMVFVAFYRWYRVSWQADERCIHISAGVLRHKRTSIPWTRITTMTVVHSVFLRPFRAVRLRADTLGGSFKNTDLTLLLSPAHAEQLLSMVRGPRSTDEPVREYTPPTVSIVALSLLNSNSFAGIVFMATFISQAGKLLGNEFSDMFFGTVEEITRLTAVAIPLIPPAAALLAAILLFGWLLAFLLTYLRYRNMVVSRRGGKFTITGGLITRREYCINAADINFLDIRQSLSTMVLRLHSLYVSAVGYGKQKDDISCMIPTENADRFTAHRSSLLPGFSPIPRQLAPPRGGILRFIGQPLVPTLGIPLAAALFVWRFPRWTSFILFVSLMLMIPSIAYLVVCIINFCTSGVAFADNKYTLRYTKGLSIHTVVIPAEKIALVELRQSLLQRRKDNCDLMVFTCAEGRYRHHLYNLSRKQLLALFAPTLTDTAGH